MIMDASVELVGVTVDFRVYSADTRSLKKDLLRRGTGGRIGRDAGSRLTVRALEDVNLSLRRGDRVGLVGANGAGKTTLLRVLAGIYQPIEGRVHCFGRVASLFDISLGLEPGATGYENILLRGLLLGFTPAEIRERTNEIASFTGLGTYLAMPVYTYSTGMMLRLAFAVSTCIDPEILLMDEWIGVGDAAFLEKAERRLEELVDQASILVFASQNHELLQRVCTKGVLLESGRVQAVGGIGEVLQHYRPAGH